MLNTSFKNRQQGTSSPRIANGSTRGANSDSTRAEVGEIDTRAPFESVKAAVNLFGAVLAFSKAKPVVRKTKTTSSENVINKETQLLLAQNELNKLKEHLQAVETTKSRGDADLEKAKKTMEDLTEMLKSVNESKQSALEIIEDLKKQVTELESSLERKSPTIRDGVWKQDLDDAKNQYLATFSELDSAKQELIKIRQDFDSTLEAKTGSFEQAANAQCKIKANTERTRQLSKEISVIRESRSQVIIAYEHVLEGHAMIVTARNARLQSHLTAMEETDSKLKTLKEEIDPEISFDLEKRLAKTTVEIKDIQVEMKIAHASEMESVKILTSEINDATEKLQQLADEKNTLQKKVESLKIKVEKVRNSQVKLTTMAEETESIAGDLLVKLEESKIELESSLAEETEVSKNYDEMVSKLQQVSSDTENAKKEAEKLKQNAEKHTRDSEVASVAVEGALQKLQIAMKESEEAESAEKIAIDENKILSERTSAAISSDFGTCSVIKLSVEEFELLKKKAEESEKLVEMKLGAAKVRLEAINASQNVAEKMSNASLGKIEDMKSATEAALKRAETDEDARKAVEGEIVRWRKGKKNKKN